MCEKLKLDWIKTDAEIDDDPNIDDLIEKRGAAGIGLYEFLRIAIGKEGRVQDAALTCSCRDGRTMEPTNLRWLTKRLHLRKETDTVAFLEDLVAFKLIDKTLWEQFRVVSIPSFLRYHHEILKRRGNGPHGILGGRPPNHDDSPVISGEAPPPLGFQTETRVEGSREEKRGVEESSGISPPSLERARALTEAGNGRDRADVLDRYSEECARLGLWGPKRGFGPSDFMNLWNLGVLPLCPGLAKMTELPRGKLLDQLVRACRAYPDPRHFYAAAMIMVDDPYYLGQNERREIKLSPTFLWGPPSDPGGNARNFVTGLWGTRRQPPDPLQSLDALKHSTAGEPLPFVRSLKSPDDSDPFEPAEPATQPHKEAARA